jgi:hypothetical protein
MGGSLSQSSNVGEAHVGPSASFGTSGFPLTTYILVLTGFPHKPGANPNLSCSHTLLPPPPLSAIVCGRQWDECMGASEQHRMCRTWTAGTVQYSTVLYILVRNAAGLCPSSWQGTGTGTIPPRYVNNSSTWRVRISTYLEVICCKPHSLIASFCCTQRRWKNSSCEPFILPVPPSDSEIMQLCSRTSSSKRGITERPTETTYCVLYGVLYFPLPTTYHAVRTNLRSSVVRLHMCGPTSDPRQECCFCPWTSMQTSTLSRQRSKERSVPPQLHT